MNHDFVINYIENSGVDCINPYFPSIHITTKSEHNAWIQIVRTNCIDPEFQEFVDAADFRTYPSIFPFYTKNQDFYDAPFWNYSLMRKPLTFWNAHVYAVMVDDATGIITPTGGIQWGFTFSYFRIMPKMIVPSALNPLNWEQDWTVFQSTLNTYKNQKCRKL